MSFSKKSSVLCSSLLFCPGHGPPSALPANCPGFLHPSGTAGGGCGMGTLTPAPRSGWRCVRVAPYRRLPRLTSLATGTTFVSGGTHPNRRGYLFPGATCCPTRHPTRESIAGPLRAPLLLLRGAYAGAAVSGLAYFPYCTCRNCPCCATRGSPFLDVGRPRPRRHLSRNPPGTTGGGVA